MPEGPTLRDHLEAIRRRKWLFVAGVATPVLLAVLFTLRQAPVYEAAAEVLVKREDVAATGLIGETAPYQDPSRLAETQAELARTPDLLARVLAAAGGGGETTNRFRARSDVYAKGNSDILVFVVRDADQARAAVLASTYARQFVSFRRALDTRALGPVLDDVERRIAQLESSGDEDTPLFASLVEKREQLGTLEALAHANVFVVRSAAPADAEQIEPRPKRNLLLGLALGLVAGAALVFLGERLDTRVRSRRELEEALGLSLLGRLSVLPPRRRDRELTMLAAPRSVEAEAYRFLRAGFEVAALERRARVVLFTSIAPGSGTAEIVGNLGIALARKGIRVALVDLDVRGGALTAAFGLTGAPGLTSVAGGGSDLERALNQVVLADRDPSSSAAGGNGRAQAGAVLEVLAAGPLPESPGELVASSSVADLLATLRDRADFVLVDCPPLVGVADVTAVARAADAVVLAVDTSGARRPLLEEARRLLDASPTAKLGFVLVEEGRRARWGRTRPERGPERAPARPVHGLAQAVRRAVGEGGQRVRRRS